MIFLGVAPKSMAFSEYRPAAMKAPEKSCVVAGMELPEENDSSVKLTHAEFAKNLEPLTALPELESSRQRRLSSDDIKMRHSKSGELRWLATVSRPDIRARLARIASTVNSLRGGGICCLNDLVETVKAWERATAYNVPLRPILARRSVVMSIEGCWPGKKQFIVEPWA